MISALPMRIPDAVSRREFLVRSTALIAGTGLLAGKAGAVAAETANGFRLRYVLASSLYGNLPLAEILPEVAPTGCTGLDLWPKPHGTQREEVDLAGVDAFRARLADAGVRCAMTTRYDLGPFKLEEEIRLLKRLEGEVVVTGGAGPVGLTGDELKGAVRTFAEKLKPTLAVAEEAGITVAIENHGKNLIDSPDSIRWLVEFAPSPKLGIALAPYHLAQDSALIAGIIKDLGSRLAVFYGWQHGNGAMQAQPKEQELAQLPGRGPLDFAPILGALRDIRYSGITEIFMHPFPRGLPILPTVAGIRAELNRARSELDRIVSQLSTSP